MSNPNNFMQYVMEAMIGSLNSMQQNQAYDAQLAITLGNKETQVQNAWFGPVLYNDGTSQDSPDGAHHIIGGRYSILVTNLSNYINNNPNSGNDPKPMQYNQLASLAQTQGNTATQFFDNMSSGQNQQVQTDSTQQNSEVQNIQTALQFNSFLASLLAQG